MRRFVVMAVLLLGAGAAQAQVLWLGAGTGTSWEWQPQTAPDTKFYHASDQAPTGFVALPLESDTLLRLTVADVQHGVQLDTGAVAGKLRSYTLGVDYFVPGVIGDARFAAGFGAYEFRPKYGLHPELKERKFGWYFGVGEWFTLSNRTRFTVDLTMHRTGNLGDPVVVALTAGLALAF